MGRATIEQVLWSQLTCLILIQGPGVVVVATIEDFACVQTLTNQLTYRAHGARGCPEHSGTLDRELTGRLHLNLITCLRRTARACLAVALLMPHLLVLNVLQAGRSKEVTLAAAG